MGHKHHKRPNVGHIFGEIGRKINHTVSPVFHSGTQIFGKILDEPIQLIHAGGGVIEKTSSNLSLPLTLGAVALVIYFVTSKR